MRVADKMNYNQVRSNLNRNRLDLADLQNKAAIQKKVTRPSDDPLAVTRILSAKSDTQQHDQFLKSVEHARLFLETADHSLGELTNLLMRAKELALSQANDPSAGAESRRIVATEIQQLFQQSVQIGNRKAGDRYLFGGFQTTSPPFSRDGEYRGDDGEIEIQINKDASVAMNIPGSWIFTGGPSDVLEESSVYPVLAKGDALGENRSPASLASEDNSREVPGGLSESWQSGGRNIFQTLSTLELALRVDDKATVQDSLENLDESISQVVLLRSNLGSRVNTLQNTIESLSKGQIDAQSMISQLEDVDIFELVTDINKAENTLQASLSTSSKLIQPSLLDFLR